jgi:hypothetical protein
VWQFFDVKLIFVLHQNKKMDCKVKAEQDGSYTFSVNMKLDGSMLDMENDIQGVVNKLGIEATLQALKGFGGVLNRAPPFAKQ